MSKKVIYFLMFFIYLGGFLAYDIYDYTQNKKILYAQMEKQLETAIKNSTILINDSYVDRLTTLSKEEYLEIAKKLTLINDNQKTTYIYAYIKAGSDIYFIATSYKPNEWSEAYDSDFLKSYASASQKLKDAFDNKKPYFEDTVDKWGSFKSMLIPYTTKRGVTYIIGADIDVSYVESAMKEINFKNTVLGIYFMILLIPIVWLFYRLMENQKKLLEEELQERTGLINRMSLLQKVHIEKLTRIATALSSESNMPALLEMILDGAKELSYADGGTLYLKTPKGDALNFHVVKTSSLGIAMGGTKGEITWPSLPLHLPDGTQNRTMVAALCAITGEIINIPDVYEAEGFNFEGTKKFDASNNFRSKSMLVLPLRNHEGEIIGVLQLINKIGEGGEVMSFGDDDKITALSLASQAAMAITNRLLIAGLEGLLMAFIESIAKAIDKKSPYTGGHVRKVAEIALSLARGISDDERFPDIKFSEDELKQIHIAGLMHDIGKISTPVHIVDKSTKLETIYDRIELVVLKCELLKHQKPEFREKIDSDIEFLKIINKGGEFMADVLLDRLHEIASQQVIVNGVKQNLLTDDEVYNLSIKRGTLTKEDRDVINGHALLSVQMLETLPFPKKLARVPEIAGNHHEQPCGKGYPRGLKGDELSLESRIMAIADIFEALSASDRPYKEGKKLSECFKILGFMAKDDEIDARLLKFYYESRLYMEFAEKNLKPYQIDDVPELKI